MNKILLGFSVLAGCIASIIPEAGITIERATFVTVFNLAIVKLVELMENHD